MQKENELLLVFCCVPFLLTMSPPNLSRTYPWLRYGAPCIHPVLLVEGILFFNGCPPLEGKQKGNGIVRAPENILTYLMIYPKVLKF